MRLIDFHMLFLDIKTETHLLTIPSLLNLAADYFNSIFTTCGSIKLLENVRNIV